MRNGEEDDDDEKKPHFNPRRLHIRITDIKMKLHPEILKFPWNRSSNRNKASEYIPNAQIHFIRIFTRLLDQLQNN